MERDAKHQMPAIKYHNEKLIHGMRDYIYALEEVFVTLEAAWAPTTEDENISAQQTVL